MRIWSFAINAGPSRPDVTIGVIMAETVAEALALIGHADANMYPLPGNVEWTGDEIEFVQTMSPPAQGASGPQRRDV
jgi:hypothetical protein